MLNILWVSFFIISFLFALIKSLYWGQIGIWNELTLTLFASAKSAFSICLNLTGLLCLWLGLLKIAEESGLTNVLAAALRPLFKKNYAGSIS